MKKHYLILTAVTVLALAAMSCGLQFVTPTPTPTPAPQGPVPQNFNPGDPGHQGPGPQNVNPGPQGPDHPNPGNPGQEPGPIPGGDDPVGNPNEGQILSFTVDRMSLNKGECALLHWETQGGFGASLDGQPVERAGQRQVCPQQTTVYRLGVDVGNQMLTREITVTVNGGNQNPNPIATTVTPKTKKSGPKPDITVTPVTPSSPNIQILPVTLVVANLDLAISNIYPSSTGHIMGTIKNAGNTTISGTYKITCSAVTLVIADDGTPIKTDYLSSYVQSVKINSLAPGKSTDFDTSFSRTKEIDNMWASCSLTPPSNDRNSTNDSMDQVQVK